jgi:hypothetical protein
LRVGVDDGRIGNGLEPDTGDIMENDGFHGECPLRMSAMKPSLLQKFRTRSEPAVRNLPP